MVGIYLPLYPVQECLSRLKVARNDPNDNSFYVFLGCIPVDLAIGIRDLLTDQRFEKSWRVEWCARPSDSSSVSVLSCALTGNIYYLRIHADLRNSDLTMLDVIAHSVSTGLQSPPSLEKFDLSINLRTN